MGPGPVETPVWSVRQRGFSFRPTRTPTPVGLDENGCVTRNMLDGLLDDGP
jgi:hypothetical protein